MALCPACVPKHPPLQSEGCLLGTPVDSMTEGAHSPWAKQKGWKANPLEAMPNHRWTWRGRLTPQPLTIWLGRFHMGCRIVLQLPAVGNGLTILAFSLSSSSLLYSHINCLHSDPSQGLCLVNPQWDTFAELAHWQIWLALVVLWTPSEGLCSDMLIPAPTVQWWP